MADILVVDDDQSIAAAFQRFLSHEGHHCRIASNATEALQSLADRRAHLVLMDIRMPGVDGLQALPELRSAFPDVPVVMMTGYGTSQTSIDAIRAGAFDYLTKPLDLDQLRAVINKALAAQRRADEAAADEPAAEAPRVELIGAVPAMLDVYKMIGRLATNDVPALIVGERGTGKRLVAATIHDNSPRRDRLFVPVDCGSLSESALDRELAVDGTGTIYLAGVDALSPALQAHVLRALEADARRPRAAGADAVRAIAASEVDLMDAVRAGQFSRELYELLSLVTIRLPPLRERRADIPLLVRAFVQRLNVQLNRAVKGVDDAATRLLEKHHWPGNVAELERVIARACIVSRTDVLTSEDIAPMLSDSRFTGRDDADAALVRAVRAALHDRLVVNDPAKPSPFHQLVDLVERTLVGEALTITNGNQVKASELLSVNRATLRKKMPAE